MKKFRENTRTALTALMPRQKRLLRLMRLLKILHGDSAAANLRLNQQSQEVNNGP
jgi:hypothetical protein